MQDDDRGVAAAADKVSRALTAEDERTGCAIETECVGVAETQLPDFCGVHELLVLVMVLVQMVALTGAADLVTDTVRAEQLPEPARERGVGVGMSMHFNGLLARGGNVPLQLRGIGSTWPRAGMGDAGCSTDTVTLPATVRGLT